jgi:cytochrome c oxidase subunit 3
MLAHQFDDLHQQHETSELGMWAFLATEVMFFGGLFSGFTMYRIFYLPGFAEGARHLKLWAGSINTAVLLCSSLTVALSVAAARQGKQKQLVGLLLATIVLGLIFLGIKGTEYYLEYKEGLVPFFHFTHQGPHADQLDLFMRFYFTMTAIHALHMIIGISLFTVITILAWRGRFSTEYYNPVDVSGLYWHFVDIVWIFLFPTLYLLR